MESFKGMGAKMRFRAALANGKSDVAENAAAEMLQGAWRSKLAKRKVMQKRAEKQRLREEAYARKIQAKYRSRLARRRVEALRAEKQRLMEEFSAIKMQGAWRRRKAKKRVEELKARRQALREEGAAIMFQSAWRCRKARRRANELKERKRRLMEEACALKLQSRWRIRQARGRVNGLRKERDDRIKKNNSAAVMQRIVRRLLCVRKLQRERLRTGCVLKIRFKEAVDINIADVSTSDPYVVAAGTVQESIAWHTCISLTLP
jgi:hypothetical protein